MEIIFPRSGENTMMQVNIGEGKSSVIIPIAAAALADGKQLVRVVVPKALTVQMFETLVVRLGGLANRPIYNLPFSRIPEYDHWHSGMVISLHIDDLHQLMQRCMVERGIILVQPEHVVSLKLTSVEQQLREGKLPADSLPRLQKIYKHVTVALSLKSVGANNPVDDLNLTDCLTPAAARQHCGYPVSMAKTVIRPLEKNGCHAGTPS